MLVEASILASRGYGVLLPASRGCSGGRSSLGAQETNDLEFALRFVTTQAPSAWIGVIGFSAGGVAAIRRIAAHPEVRAVVAIGNYANMWLEIQATQPTPLSLEWQLQRAVALLLWVQLGVSPASVSPIDDLPRLSPPRPVLLSTANGKSPAQRGRAVPCRARTETALGCSRRRPRRIPGSLPKGICPASG